jgi:uncharacterized linocin/CFP29 family protein
MAGANTDLHERVDVLSDEAIDLHRALVSVQEELEAVDWYDQRSLTLGPRCYTSGIETTPKGGYPVLEQLRLIAGGRLTRAPAVDGSVVTSVRGRDDERTLGERLSIGSSDADGGGVTLYIEESVAFRAHTPDAAVALVYEA